MPDYSKPFGIAGATAGAASGGVLGQLLGVLGNPREAMWNIPNKLMEGDFLGAAPGLAGLGVAGLGAALGGGLPLAALGGALAGGLGQTIGKGIDPERFQAPSGGDLIEMLGGDRDSTLGRIGGMGLEMAGDPLTFAGGLGGRAKGAQYGGYLGDLAFARGPNYPGDAEKLESMLGSTIGTSSPRTSNFPQRVQSILDGPYRDRILGEIRPGATALAQGEEAMVLRNSPDSVLRIAGGPGALDVAARNRGEASYIGRPTAPDPTPGIQEMLQPGREVAIGPYRISHSPYVDTAPQSVLANDYNAMTEEMNRVHRAIEPAVRAKGYDTEDMHLGNFGRIEPGRYAVTDPGSATAPTPPVEALRDLRGDPISNTLLNMLGADRSVQREIEQRLAHSRATSGVHLPFIPAEVAHQQAQLPAALQRAEAGHQAALDRLVDLHARGRPIPERAVQQGILNTSAADVSQMREALGMPLRGTDPDLLELIRQRIQLAEQGTRPGG